ncbi:hypothetical protein FOXB_16617, partial [Fusarium oxysporum f. sp. conglutinans Fo5176]
NISYNKTF